MASRRKIISPAQFDTRETERMRALRQRLLTQPQQLARAERAGTTAGQAYPNCHFGRVSSLRLRARLLLQR